MRVSDSRQKQAKTIPSSKLDSLSENIDALTKKLENREMARKQKNNKRRQQLNDLYDAIEEKSNVVVSKIEDLSRKPTIIIQVSKILPQIPENFPKNYNLQIVYEDITATGNQKFTDFDENVIDEKFILPLLSSETARMEVWVAQEEPSVFDCSIINLEADIQAALEDPLYNNEISLETNPNLSVSYKVQVQGIGFQAWLKNIRSSREMEEERRKARKQSQLKQTKTRQKIEQKKMNFNKKFQDKEKDASKTKEYNLKGIEDIINFLDD